uniref:(northern house mosquito) hypothetical protein n=1 Tax=Culex pipiens TaxID=7175 RepID=A0A8D8B6N2_CULPI
MFWYGSAKRGLRLSSISASLGMFLLVALRMALVFWDGTLAVLLSCSVDVSRLSLLVVCLCLLSRILLYVMSCVNRYSFIVSVSVLRMICALIPAIVLFNVLIL